MTLEEAVAAVLKSARNTSLPQDQCKATIVHRPDGYGVIYHQDDKTHKFYVMSMNWKNLLKPKL